MHQSIISHPEAFTKAFLAQAASDEFDHEYGPVLRVLLYYLWRGTHTARSAGLGGVSTPSNALLALAAYKAVIPILQLTRIGYEVDAFILSRALMERIAILGYLEANRGLISRYFGGMDLNKTAMLWAKRNALPNWMQLYSTLSSIAHSKIVGPAGHLFDRTAIGAALREGPLAPSRPPAFVTDELLGHTIYSLMALDPIALRLVGSQAAKPIPHDVSAMIYVGLPDLQAFADLLTSLACRYSSSVQ